MKKILSIFVLVLTTLSLTSCKVNWFGDTIDVPWYYVLTPILLISVLGYIILMSLTYICPKCKTEFKAKPYELYVMIHLNRKRLAKCPCCKRKEFCKIKRK